LQKQQPKLDPKRLVFLSMKPASPRRLLVSTGGHPQGERLVQKVPHGNWKTVTFIAALRSDRVTAPFVLEGPMCEADSRPLGRLICSKAPAYSIR